MTLDPPPQSAGKAEWRRWAKAQRQPGVDPEVSRMVTAAISEWLPEAPPGVVVLYLAIADEIDLSDLLADPSRQFALTRTPPEGPLTVHSARGPRERHRYGFEQPVAESPLIETSHVGVVLVPGLLFDRSGARLGRGAGYYDTFLPTIPAHAARVGVVESGLVQASVPTEPHDVSMTHLATEIEVTTV